MLVILEIADSACSADYPGINHDFKSAKYVQSDARNGKLSSCDDAGSIEHNITT